MPTTSIADIVFNCPHCRGPIMVERVHIGEFSECPHCFESIQVPELSAVNKDRFVEPPGLRRILQEVRDREWEHMRRKLRNSRAQIVQLEKDLAESKQAAATAVATAVDQEVREAKELQDYVTQNHSLQQQLAEMGEKFVLANQAFMSGRKQHDQALEKLRRDLEAAQKEVQLLQKKNETPKVTAKEVESLRQQVAGAAEEIASLKASLEAAKTESAELQTKLTLAESKAEMAQNAAAESAAVLSTEDGLRAGQPAAENENDAQASSSLGEVERLKKSRAAVVEARDRACAELEVVKKALAVRDHEDEVIESAITGLESGIKEVMWALAARRERKG